MKTQFFINAATHCSIYMGGDTDVGEPFPHLGVEVIMLNPRGESAAKFLMTIIEIIQWGDCSFTKEEFASQSSKDPEIWFFYLKDETMAMRFKLRWAQ